MTPAEQIHEKLLQLKKVLDEQNPGMENWLRDIHTNLNKDESLAQILSPEEVAWIVTGLSIKAKIKIVDDTVKTKVSKATLSKLTVDDL